MLLYCMMCHCLFFCLSLTHRYPQWSAFVCVCVCVFENIRHISRVYADEPRCTRIHKDRICLQTTFHPSSWGGERVSENPRTVNAATAQRNDGPPQWHSLKHQIAFLMSVQTLHRNECITVHGFVYLFICLLYFFSFFFFFWPVVQGRKGHHRGHCSWYVTGRCMCSEFGKVI